MTKNIIILREKDRAQCLEKILVSRGYNVIVQPVIKVTEKKFNNFNLINFDAVMFTSVNSIKILIKHLDKKSIAQTKAFCVGEVTEKWASFYGFNCIKTYSNSGKSLETAILKSNLKINKIALYSGQKIAHNPSKEFKKAGIEIIRIILYNTKPVKILPKIISKSLSNKNSCYIVFYSPYIAKTFNSLTKNYSFKNFTAICLGLQTRKILEKRKWKKILVVRNVNPKNFAKLIIDG